MGNIILFKYWILLLSKITIAVCKSITSVDYFNITFNISEDQTELQPFFIKLGQNEDECSFKMIPFIAYDCIKLSTILSIAKYDTFNFLWLMIH